ncbi:hypothetical protein [Roseospira goensis]|uniref:Uncharacterized protein n=1 Tax=Roseospira goensis TaxID=391922 RepID=A0A7W6S0W8_9PROT|nr:hypothetical protein [Roseospira goensis]MBB4286819.1 hypothetical protein [Roseospira goensis]
MEDDADERAAIAEFDGGIPREWCDGWARLQAMAPPAGCTPRQWARLIDDAGRFLDQWAATASSLGWTTADVWGVHPTRPMARYDHMGLVGLLDGARVVVLTADTATLRTASGATNNAYRRPVTGSVPVWTLRASP